MKPVRIGLLGCGTVGGGVVKLLLRNPDKYRRILGAPLELAAVADRSLAPDDLPGLPAKNRVARRRPEANERAPPHIPKTLPRQRADLPYTP